MAKFVSYTRVSSEKQGRSGLGLEAQQNLIDTYLAREGGELVEAVVEVESGSKDERPGLHRALALCRRHRAVLLIARLDRLGRRLSFLAHLLDADVDLRVADSPGASKLTLQLLAVVAEAERDLIRDRTRQALAAAKARGQVLGKNGLRLRDEATLAARTLYQTHKQDIDAAFCEAATLRMAAGILNARSVPTREPGAWGPGNTSRLQKRLGLALTG